MEEILLTKEVADKLRVSEYHIRKLIKKDLIKAYKEGRRGGYRIEGSEVDRYIKEKLEGRCGK